METVITKKTVAVLVLLVIIICSSMVYSHCQIPCGIYNDHARLDMMAEHITTIEKAIRQIVMLSERDEPNTNQIVRWVQNKEKHADELSHIVTYYFMSQRIKPAEKTSGKAYAEYTKQLTLLHKILVYTMKIRQTTDLANVEKLRSLLDEFKTEYF